MKPTYTGLNGKCNFSYLNSSSNNFCKGWIWNTCVFCINKQGPFFKFQNPNTSEVGLTSKYIYKRHNVIQFWKDKLRLQILEIFRWCRYFWTTLYTLFVYVIQWYLYSFILCNVFLSHLQLSVRKKSSIKLKWIQNLLICHISRVISRYGSSHSERYIHLEGPYSPIMKTGSDVSPKHFCQQSATAMGRRMWGGGKFGFGGRDLSVSNISAPHFGRNNFLTNAWVIGFRRAEAAMPTKKNNTYRQFRAVFHLFKTPEPDDFARQFLV